MTHAFLLPELGNFNSRVDELRLFALFAPRLTLCSAASNASDALLAGKYAATQLLRSFYAASTQLLRSCALTLHVISTLVEISTRPV